MSRLALFTSFLFALGILTWQEVHKNNRTPHPDVYMHAVLVWAVLGVISDLGVPEIAAVFGIGLALSMAYTSFAPKEQPVPAANDAAAK